MNEIKQELLKQRNLIIENLRNHESGFYDGWLDLLLEENNISNTDELTKNIIDEAINDTYGSMKNELLWALGYANSKNPHLENLEIIYGYLEYLIELQKLFIGEFNYE